MCGIWTIEDDNKQTKSNNGRRYHLMPNTRGRSTWTNKTNYSLSKAEWLTYCSKFTRTYCKDLLREFRIIRSSLCVINSNSSFCKIALYELLWPSRNHANCFSIFCSWHYKPNCIMHAIGCRSTTMLWIFLPSLTFQLEWTSPDPLPWPHVRNNSAFALLCSF